MLNGIIYSAFVSLLFLVACGSAPEEDGGMITSSGGEDLDTLTATDSVVYDLSNQPDIITHFFRLTNDQIGADYCYDEMAVKNLLMGEGADEHTWTSKKVGENFLRFENEECFVTTEFLILNNTETTVAILLQTIKGDQQIDYYWHNEDADKWEENLNPPELDNWDFYYSLEDSEQPWVDDYGVFFAYLNESMSKISFQFSTWQMGLNADGKEIMDFNKEPDYSYDLMYGEFGFWLKKVYENKELTPNRYFLAYSETGEISDDFSYFSEMIEQQLKEDGVESAYADFSQTNYNGYFSNDTFNFSAMQQFEPRNGFWFYERGKEPLDLEYDMVDPTVKRARRYFYEKP